MLRKYFDNGLLVFMKQKGNVILNELFTTEYEALHTEQSNLTIAPISMDHTMFIESKKQIPPASDEGLSEAEKTKQLLESNQSLQCLIGTRDCSIYIYDPILVGQGTINVYNNDSKMPFFKDKRPEIVKWVEPIGKNNATQFVAVFEDGCIYLYEKDVNYDIKEDFTKVVMPASAKKQGDKPITKADVVVEMQRQVENFDFEQIYKAQANPLPLSPKMQQLQVNQESSLDDLVNYHNCIHDWNHRHYNYACSYYSQNDKQVNPKLILRFDCKVINELQVLRLNYDQGNEQHEIETPNPDAPESLAASSSEKKILFLVAACNDHYIKFFNLRNICMAVSFKGRDHNGAPLCFDISPDRKMIAVGFEDDSFIAYNFEVQDGGNRIEVVPIVRGVGHKNFISNLKFDVYFQQNHFKYLQRVFEEESEMFNPIVEQMDTDGDINMEEDEVSAEGVTNFDQHRLMQSKEDKKMIMNMQSKIKNSVK